MVKLGDDRVTPARIAAAAADGSALLAGAATFAAGRVARVRPASAPAIAAALAPALGDESWYRRLAAVEALTAWDLRDWRCSNERAATGTPWSGGRARRAGSALTSRSAATY